MGEWVRLCGKEEIPQPGEVKEIEAGPLTLCVANVEGDLHAVDNWCPHRAGPLGQGWIEGRTVVCPWHAWAFDCKTGIAEAPEVAQVRVFPLRQEDEGLMVDLS